MVTKLKAGGSYLTDDTAKRRAEIMMKMNQALKMNNKAVLDEQERLTDPQYERRKNRDEFFSKQRSI